MPADGTEHTRNALARPTARIVLPGHAEAEVAVDVYPFRFRVARFHGACARCLTNLGEGAKIGSPHHLVCYRCHHEPHLVLAA